MNYQINEVVPYWIKTTVLRRRGLKTPQLYRFETVEYDGGEEFREGKSGSGSEGEEVKPGTV